MAATIELLAGTSPLLALQGDQVVTTGEASAGTLTLNWRVTLDGGETADFSDTITVEGPALITQAPAYKSNGTVGANTSATSVNVPLAANAVDDILIVHAICRGSTEPLTMPAGWAEVTPQINVGGNQIGFFWKRATGAETVPALGNAGRTGTNLLSGQMTCYSGCKTDGNPIENVTVASSASGVMIGAPVTTQGLKRLAVQAWVRGTNSAAGPTLGWTENLDQGTSGGGGARYFVDTAVLDYDGTIPASNRGGTGQLYGMIGFSLVGIGVDQVAAPKDYTRGLWVWDSATVIPSDDQQHILLNEAVTSEITDVYVYSPSTLLTGNAAALRSFIAKATYLGIRVWGMDGWREWFSDALGPTELYDLADDFIAFNAASSATQKFHGFHIDMEPADLGTRTAFHNGIASSALSTVSGSGDWQDTEALDREMLMRDWVAIHEELRSRMNAAGVELGSAIPTWGDDYFGEPIVCTYDGVTKNIVQHLSDHADDLVVMNYSTTDLNQIDRIKYEVLNSNVPMSTAIETHIGVGSGVSYADTAGKATKAAALADLATVRARYAGYPMFKGDAIHDWEGWKALDPASTDTSNPVPPSKTVVRSVGLSYGSGGFLTTPGWYMVDAAGVGEDTVTNAVDLAGSATPWTIEIVDNFRGGNSSGAQTGSNTGILPDDVLRTAFFVDGNDQTAGVKVSGLDVAKTYDVLAVPSRGSITGPRATKFTLKGVVQEIDAANNTSVGALYEAVTPDPDGSLTLTVERGADLQFGYLNGLLISEVVMGGVEEPPPDPDPVIKVAQVSFGVAGITLSAGWNVITTIDGQVTNALDPDGAATGWLIDIVDDFSGNPAGSNGTTEGAQTGDNSGVVPDDVLRNFLYVDAGDSETLATVRISGLDISKLYSVRAVPSRKDLGAARLTSYTIDGTVIEVDAANNTSLSALFEDVAPESDGSITLEVRPGSGGATFGYLNALIVTETGDASVSQVTAGPMAEPTEAPMTAS